MASIDANRRHWNQLSRAYQEAHDPQIGAAPRLWGMYSIPDSDLHALGDVTGKRVLELGCGAGQWSRSLAAEGATVVGLDLSDAQLAAAARAMETARYPLVQAAAQQLPFAPASFDVVFCDHGGLSWAPPRLAVTEAARVLRQGGRLVFTVTSPWFSACYDDAADKVTACLQHSYFGPEAIPEEDGAASYQLTYQAPRTIAADRRTAREEVLGQPPREIYAARPRRRDWGHPMDEPIQPSAEMLGRLGRHWGWVLAYGVVTLIAGIAVLAWPGETLLVVAVLFGVQLIVAGVFRFVAAFATDDLTGGTRVLLALLGVLSVIIGLWAVRHALLTLLALIVLLGIFWVVNGAIELFTALSHREMPERGWTAIMGLLSVAAGVIVLAYPGLSLVGLAIILGVWLVIFGVIEILVAMRLRAA